MNSNLLTLPLFVSLLASMPLSATAAPVGKPFLNQVSCAQGFVPGTVETGCVKNVDPSTRSIQTAKRGNAKQQVGAGVSTVSQQYSSQNPKK